MAEKYRAEQLFPTAVPQWAQGGDGTWVRDWEVRLTAVPEEKRLYELERLSEQGVDVVAALSQDRRTIHLRTATMLNPHVDDVFYGSAYRMLRKIDENVGPIELIQGQPRDMWQPFRKSGAGV